MLTNIYVWETITSTRTQNVSAKPPSLLAALAPGRPTATSWPVTTDEPVCSGIPRQWNVRTHPVSGFLHEAGASEDCPCAVAAAFYCRVASTGWTEHRFVYLLICVDLWVDPSFGLQIRLLGTFRNKSSCRHPLCLLLGFWASPSSRAAGPNSRHIKQCTLVLPNF